MDVCDKCVCEHMWMSVYTYACARVAMCTHASARECVYVTISNITANTVNINNILNLVQQILGSLAQHVAILMYACASRPKCAYKIRFGMQSAKIQALSSKASGDFNGN